MLGISSARVDDPYGRQHDRRQRRGCWRYRRRGHTVAARCKATAEADQPGDPIRAVGGRAHPDGQVVADQRAGVAVVRLALGVAAGGLLEVDPAHRAPADRQPGLVDQSRPAW